MDSQKPPPVALTIDQWAAVVASLYGHIEDFKSLPYAGPQTATKIMQETLREIQAQLGIEDS